MVILCYKLCANENVKHVSVSPNYYMVVSGYGIFHLSYFLVHMILQGIWYGNVYGMT